ncbi:unnamed protein product [Vicia faba]|uniref:Uncharacterized protein n=1 Tax=Vicia faba TaxID=3906 RepID=A0AAV0ZLP6_VICFA|nr:unnamed protein product [Vicia faba]
MLQESETCLELSGRGFTIIPVIPMGGFGLCGTLLIWCLGCMNSLINFLLTLWQDIEQFSCTTQDPWIIVGDYNNVLHTMDHIGGNPVQHTEIVDLENLMNAANLFELDTIGYFYTWSNKHKNDLIYSRIDRAIGNMEWFHTCPNYILEILKCHISDHSPLILSLPEFAPLAIRHQARFKFINNVVEHSDFKQVVENSWKHRVNGKHMYMLWRKLKRLQPFLRNLNRRINTGIINCCSKLENAKNNLAGDLFKQEFAAQVQTWSKKLMEATVEEEKLLIHKAKINWLQLGDGNNAFFHAICDAVGELT